MQEMENVKEKKYFDNSRPGRCRKLVTIWKCKSDIVSSSLAIFNVSPVHVTKAYKGSERYSSNDSLHSVGGWFT
jgi:hypothetical protein